MRQADTAPPAGEPPGSGSWGHLAPATRAVRVGQRQDVSDQHSEALVLTSSYEFADAEDAAEKFAGRRAGNVYVRFTNPTVRAFEQRMAALEDAEDATAMGSGMASYSAIALAFLQAGDRVLLARGIFGTTTKLFEYYFRKFGIESTSLAVDAPISEWRRNIDERTRLVIVESPTNPVLGVADIRMLAARCRQTGTLLLVDNTLCTPVFQRPHLLGADLVLHSAGKYIDGHGRCGGGVVTGSERLIAELHGVLRTTGPSLSPFNAWTLLKSLESLSVRMRQHQENAEQIVSWLAGHPAVCAVHYTGRPDHPQAELVARQQTGHGGLLSFRVDGDRRHAWRVVDNVRLISNTTNIGDTKTMITHPASTTHGRLSQAQRATAGVTDDLLRISVGFESPEDVIMDLEQALHGAMQIQRAQPA